MNIDKAPCLAVIKIPDEFLKKFHPWALEFHNHFVEVIGPMGYKCSLLLGEQIFFWHIKCSSDMMDIKAGEISNIPDAWLRKISDNDFEENITTNADKPEEILA
jgi:hypothetical protein